MKLKNNFLDRTIIIILKNYNQQFYHILDEIRENCATRHMNFVVSKIGTFFKVCVYFTFSCSPVGIVKYGFKLVDKFDARAMHTIYKLS